MCKSPTLTFSLTKFEWPMYEEEEEEECRRSLLLNLLLKTCQTVAMETDYELRGREAWRSLVTRRLDKLNSVLWVLN